MNHRKRLHGTSKYGISRTIRVVLDLLTVKFLISYSTRPLQIFGLLGARRWARSASLACLLARVREVRALHQGIADRPLLLAGIVLIVMGVQLPDERAHRRDAGEDLSRVAGQADLRDSRDPGSAGARPGKDGCMRPADCRVRSWIAASRRSACHVRVRWIAEWPGTVTPPSGGGGVTPPPNTPPSDPVDRDSGHACEGAVQFCRRWRESSPSVPTSRTTRRRSLSCSSTGPRLSGPSAVRVRR